MKKQTVLKIELLLTGILARLFDNAEFFEKIRFLYKLGEKSFEGNAVCEAGDFVVRFSGVSQSTTGEKLGKIILNGAETYESVGEPF